MYHPVIKQDGLLRTRGKCRKHQRQAIVFHITRVFSNVRSVLSQCDALGFFVYQRFYPPRVETTKRIGRKAIKELPNVDYKIASKAIATRIEKVLH